jgi:hypothetical protein
MISTAYSYSRMIGRVSGNNPEGKFSRHKTYDNVCLFPVGKKTTTREIMFSTTRRLIMSADAKVRKIVCKLEQKRVDFSFSASDTSNHNSETTLMRNSVHTQVYDNFDQGTTSCNLCPKIHCLIRISDDSMELLGTWRSANTIMFWVSYSTQNDPTIESTAPSN